MFLSERFEEFGIYEDAIVKEEIFLNHSLLSPLMNAGLISPRKVINESLLFAQNNDIPLNSLEGLSVKLWVGENLFAECICVKGILSNSEFLGF